MPHHHVIIGGGPAATNAVQAMRQLERNRCAITLISDEPAHSRMALPYWLSGQIPCEHTYTGDDRTWAELGVDARIGQKVVRIDPHNKSVTLGSGDSLSFDTLLLATGSVPNSLSIPGADLPGVLPMWTLSHTQQALAKLNRKAKPRVALVGAGFIGFIVLNAMYKRGWQLTVIERLPQVLPRMLAAQPASLVQRWLQQRSIDVRCNTAVQSITAGPEDSPVLHLTDGSSIEVDWVVVAVGVRPNIELAQSAGIQTDQGILVNAHMQTSFPHIYAAGDVAQGPALFNDHPQVHAIQPTAVDHGRIAGANMVGHAVPYPGSLSMNVLDACGLQCASFGNWDDTRAEPVIIANPDSFIFRALHFRDDQIVGAAFVGRASDMGMLTDVGMVKGIMQTQTRLGIWKEFLEENPFDIRRAFVALKVAHRLARTTLLGQPTQDRSYRFGHVSPEPAKTAAHHVFVAARDGQP